MRIVVTGGAGYIGSHTTVGLLEQGHEVLILDNFANAARDVPDRIASIAGRTAEVEEIDITDRDSIVSLFTRFRPQATIHFAGLKAVSEAVRFPLEYYRVNVAGSLALFQAMEEADCCRLVFSSSATVYGDPDCVPIPENHPLRPTNPYGQSKRMAEQLIEDWVRAWRKLAAVNLRYFNPVGAHPSARIGEAPRNTPSNLVPFVAQVAAGQRDHVSVFGQDYSTPDGTGVRDYIHVMDLAAAHLTALDLTSNESGVHSINVGTGQGYSVLEVIKTFEAVSERDVPFVITGRRPGDVAVSVADPELSARRMGWRAKRGLKEMCKDAWAWQKTQM